MFDLQQWLIHYTGAPFLQYRRRFTDPTGVSYFRLGSAVIEVRLSTVLLQHLRQASGSKRHKVGLRARAAVLATFGNPCVLIADRDRLVYCLEADLIAPATA